MTEATIADTDRKQTAKLRKLWLLNQEGPQLDDYDRLELASVILRRDILSWKHLDEDQLDRMLDAYEGWEKINELLHQRR